MYCLHKLPEAACLKSHVTICAHSTPRCNQCKVHNHLSGFSFCKSGTASQSKLYSAAMMPQLAGQFTNARQMTTMSSHFIIVCETGNAVGSRTDQCLQGTVTQMHSPLEMLGIPAPQRL